MEKKQKLIRITTVAVSLLLLLKGQLRFLNRYYEVIGVAHGKKELEEVEEREGVETREIVMQRQIALLSDLKALFSLWRLFMKERPFIIHANTPKASLLAMLAGKIAGVPHRIYTVTGLRFETAIGRKRKMLIAMERLACWSATKVIPEGEGVKKTLFENKITSKPLEKIWNGNINGIDLDFYSRRTDVMGEADKIRKKCTGFVFCFIGRLVKDKGINELVQAFARLYKQNSRIQLLLVGPFEKELDPLLPETEQQIMNHPGIFFAGYQKDVRPYLAASDLFVFPSYREGFPNVVLQAGAMELPAVVSDINGSNELIKEGVNGMIIPIRDEDKLYVAMETFLQMPEEKLRKMGKEARREIEDRFDQKKVWEALLEMYHDLK